jgi:hypothetical protein
MGALPVIANTYRVTWDWYLSNNPGARAANVLHFHDTSGTGSANALFTALNTNVNNNMFAMQDPQANIYNVDIIPLDGHSPTSSYTFSSARGGSGTGEAIAQAAPLVLLKTATRGPAGRGRIFLPFLEEGAQTDGALDPTKRTTAITNWTTFRTAMDTANYPLCVATYVHADWHLVTSLSMRTVSATIRRRVNRLR